MSASQIQKVEADIQSGLKRMNQYLASNAGYIMVIMAALLVAMAGVGTWMFIKTMDDEQKQKQTLEQAVALLRAKLGKEGASLEDVINELQNGKDAIKVYMVNGTRTGAEASDSVQFATPAGGWFCIPEDPNGYTVWGIYDAATGKTLTLAAYPKGKPPAWNSDILTRDPEGNWALTGGYTYIGQGRVNTSFEIRDGASFNIDADASLQGQAAKLNSMSAS